MPDEAAIAASLVGIIAGALPEARQSNKWNAPNFEWQDRDIMTLNFPPRGGVRLVFHRGAKAVDTKTGQRLLEDAAGHLVWVTDQRATASFATLAEAEAAKSWLPAIALAWADRA